MKAYHTLPGSTGSATYYGVVTRHFRFSARDQSCGKNSLAQQRVNTLGTLDERDKVGCVCGGVQRDGGGGLVVYKRQGLFLVSSKQADTRLVLKHAAKQLDNGGVCAAVVKWSGKVSGLVGRST